MYQVSNEYLLALHQPVQKRRIRGKVGGVNFTEADVLKGSLKINNQCINSSQLVLGAVFVGQLSITFLRSFNFPRGTWANEEIELSIGLEIAPDQYEDIPVGIFNVSKATHSAVGVAITAYDRMAKLDKNCEVDSTTGQAFDVLSLIARNTGIQLANTREQIEAMPNGTEQLGLYANNDIKTWRDMTYWIAQTLGGFATFSRDGKLLIKSFTRTAVQTFPPSERMKGGTWSDFSTKYTGLSVVNMADNTTSYYSIQPDNGSTMNLGSNPFLQYGTAATVRSMREAVLGALENFKYTPFKCQTLGDVCFDLGDVFSFSGGIADNSLCCLMSYVFDYNKSYTMQGYGSDPSLEGAQSKTDKDINGLLSNQSKNEEVYYLYENASDLEIDSNETVLGSVRFAANVQTMVDIWHEFKLNTVLDGDWMRATVRYYLDGEQISYTPAETWSIDGAHLWNSHYLVEVEPNVQHTWTVTMTTFNGTAELDMGDGRIVLHGQGLVGKKGWDGVIEVADSFNVPLHMDLIASFNAEASAAVQTPIGGSVSDVLGQIAFGMNYGMGTFDENITVLEQMNTYQLVTEAGDEFITESGDTLYTEGDSN